MTEGVIQTRTIPRLTYDLFVVSKSNNVGGVVPTHLGILKVKRDFSPGMDPLPYFLCDVVGLRIAGDIRFTRNTKRRCSVSTGSKPSWYWQPLGQCGKE